MPCSIDRVANGLRVSYRQSWGWPLGLAAFALTIFWIISVRYAVECARQPDGSVRATLRAHRIGWTSAARTVEDVRSAEVETHDDTVESDLRDPHRRPNGIHVQSGRRRNQPTYVVSLIDGKNQRHPVSSMRSSGRAKHQALADGIQRFLKNPASRRAIVRQPWDPTTLLVFLFPLFGTIHFWTQRSETVVRRDNGTVQVTTWNAFLPRTTVVPLAEIREFAFLQRRRRRWGQNDRLAYDASVVRHDGSAVRFAATSNPESDEALANAVGALERFRHESQPPA